MPELAVTGTDTRKNSTSVPLGIDWPEDDKLLVVYGDSIEVHNLQSPDEPLISAPIKGTGTRTASARQNVLAVGSGRDVVLYDTRALPAIESMPIDGLRRLVCSRTGRDLTPEEWTTYFSDRPYERTCELSALATGRD